jgi:hypothetical protein
MVFDKPLTGYEIKKHIDQGVGNFYKASYGSLYPILKKSLDKGYLIMTEDTLGRERKNTTMRRSTAVPPFLVGLLRRLILTTAVIIIW